MVGKHFVEINAKKYIANIYLERNITIVTGDSGTGKTSLIKLLDLIRKGNRRITMKASAEVYIMPDYIELDFDLLRQTFEKNYKGFIIFIDENCNLINKKGFIEFIFGLDNYFVIITRDSMAQLPYAATSILTPDTTVSNTITITSFIQKYNVVTTATHVSYDFIIFEDSGSGFDVYSKLFSEINPKLKDNNIKKTIFKIE